MFFYLNRNSDEDDNIDINTIPHISFASKVSQSSIGSHKVHGGWTSSAVSEDIKNGINNKFYSGIHSRAFRSTDHDDYDFPPDAMDNMPTIYIESDDSFDSDDDDDADYVKQDSSSLQAPLINGYGRTKSAGSIQRTRQSTADHLKVQHSDLSKSTLSKSSKSKSRSNPCLKMK